MDKIEAKRLAIKIVHGWSISLSRNSSWSENDSKKMIRDITALIMESTQVHKNLIQTLEFYADKDNWDTGNALGQLPSCWDGGRLDLGNRARACINEITSITEKEMGHDEAPQLS